MKWGAGSGNSGKMGEGGAMGTTGFFGFRKGRELKIGSCRFDSHPHCKGSVFIERLAGLDGEGLDGLFANLECWSREQAQSETEPEPGAAARLARKVLGYREYARDIPFSGYCDPKAMIGEWTRAMPELWMALARGEALAQAGSVGWSKFLGMACSACGGENPQYGWADGNPVMRDCSWRLTDGQAFDYGYVCSVERRAVEIYVPRAPGQDGEQGMESYKLAAQVDLGLAGWALSGQADKGEFFDSVSSVCAQAAGKRSNRKTGPGLFESLREAYALNSGLKEAAAGRRAGL